MRIAMRDDGSVRRAHAVFLGSFARAPCRCARADEGMELDDRSA
jgi:hypothetical protein